MALPKVCFKMCGFFYNLFKNIFTYLTPAFCKIPDFEMDEFQLPDLESYDSAIEKPGQPLWRARPVKGAEHRRFGFRRF
jgi:hypothetical protein